MAWVRIHDGAMTHPKIIGLADKAFRLWVWALSYCQTHLTDGAFPTIAIPAEMRRATGDLVKAGLWETAEGGFTVHDYLEWNDSRVLVNKRRTDAKERMANARQRTSSEVLRGSVKESLNTSVRSERESERKPAAASGSNHPIFNGNRFVVFEWQLDGLRRLLGDEALEAFDLHRFLDELDQRARLQHVVIPQRDGGQWLQGQVLDEARRRGIPIASTPVETTGSKRVAALVRGGEAFLKAGDS